MSKSNNDKRFAFGSPDKVFSSIWRLTSNGDDIYLGTRAVMKHVKVSLHKSGMCQVSFTDVFMESDNPVRKQVTGSRHIETWKQQPIQQGLNKLFDIVIPHEKQRGLELPQSVINKTEWFPLCESFINTQVSFFLSDRDIGDNNWIGKRAMKTKLLHKGRIDNGKVLCVVYYGHNDKLNLPDIQVESELPEQHGNYRASFLGVDSNSGVGFLIDSVIG